METTLVEIVFLFTYLGLQSPKEEHRMTNCKRRDTGEMEMSQLQLNNYHRKHLEYC